MDKYDQDLKSILPETGWEERMATARNAAYDRRRHTYHIQPPKASGSSTDQPVRPGGPHRTDLRPVPAALIGQDLRPGPAVLIEQRKVRPVPAEPDGQGGQTGR